MKFLIPCVTSFMLTAIFTPCVIRLATACKCLDTPGTRRLHKRITPRWGGMAFFAGVLPVLFMENGNNTLTAYIVASFLLVGMGMVDDLTPLNWKSKFAVMAAATTIVIFGGDITIHHIGTYGTLGSVELDLLSIPFTYLSIIGITNAINLLDGLDGLAGGVSLLGFLFMGMAALLTGNIMAAVICFSFVGALGAFLIYNFPNARIFMGDTGSLFLGFSLAITAVLLTQDAKAPVDSMFPVLVLLIPIFDTIRVLIVRLLNGKNPFQADNLHLHYLIVAKNISPAKVSLLFWSVTTVFGGIALSLTTTTSESYLLVVLCASVFLGLFAASHTQQRKSQEAVLPAMQRPAGMGDDSFGIPHYYDTAPDFTRKREMMALKWMVVLGVILAATQAFAEEMAVLRTDQSTFIYAAGVNLIAYYKQRGS